MDLRTRGGKATGSRGSDIKLGQVTTMSRQHQTEISADPATTLRLYEQRLRVILELSTEWYWEQDEHYRFTLFLGERKNDAIGDPDSLIGSTRWDHGAMPVGDDGSWEPHKACLEARQPFRDFVFRRIDEHGELRYINASGQPVFDGGRFLGYRGTARDVTASMRAEQLLRLEHMAARCVASADSAATALEAVIRSICTTQGWECGRYFNWNEKNGVLGFNEFWHVPSPELERFIEKSRQVTYAPGAGLVGEVFSSGRPLWVTDIERDSRLQKGIARDAGMHGTCLFPVISEGRPIGVLSFHSTKVREPDARLLEAMGVIGSQIGQFMHRKLTEARVHYLATHDGLTGLPNRMLFSQLLNGAMRSAQRYAGSFAVLFVDLDGFKAVNDTQGHEAGDRLLQAMAGRFTGCLRASDIVARLGGDEFVVLVQEISEAGPVTIVARKLLAAAGRTVVLGEQSCQVTASIGVCMFPVDARDEQSLMKHADSAMYRAKKAGKNNFRFYSAQDPAPG
jgi:diguanylate cyclase (GGDEF)-like protein/PAS domain S-box-containing protein